MLKTDPEETLKDTKELRRKAVKLPAKNVESLLDEQSKAFLGIGWFLYKNTAKKTEIRLEMNPEATPVALKPQQAPCHLQKSLKK